MATLRRAVKPVLSDDWQKSGDLVEMENGRFAQLWKQPSTGLSRIVPDGMHPDDQPLSTTPYQYDDDAPIEETATDRVATMLASASSNERAELKVYRVNQGQLEFCRGFKPDEFEDGNFDMLRERFGPGVYELRLYATLPSTNRFVVRSKTRVTIAEDMGAKPSGGMDSGMAQILATIAQGQAQMLDALVAIKSAPAKDPMDEMTRMLTMMSTMREAMGMNQPQGREKSSIGEIVSAIRELRGAADEIAPPSEEKEPSMMAMLPKILDLVAAGQQSQQISAQAPQTRQPIQLPLPFNQSPVEPQNNQSAPINQQPENDVNILVMVKLRSYLKSLCDMAKAEKPVMEGAQFIYDKLPDELIEIMALENWFDLLSAVASDVTPYKEWLTKARDVALGMFEPSETEAPK